MRSLALSCALAVVALVACSSDPPPRTAGQAPRDGTLPESTPTNGAGQPPPAPPPSGPAPKPIVGLEDLPLEGHERQTFATLMGELFAPCASQAVPLRQCVEERRSCAACVPAARLLGQKIHEGMGAEEARRLYAVRFGADVHKFDADDSPSRGPANAPVTIVVWSDFECPHCKHAMPYLEQALGKYDGKVRLVHKFYPLRQHTHAEASARAAIAAQNQGRYWEMEHVLFDHQDQQSDSDLAGYAADLKLDMRKWTTDLSAEKTTKIIERDHAEADKAGLSGTPFILINGRELDSTLFHIGTDLDPWIELEIKLAGR